MSCARPSHVGMDMKSRTKTLLRELWLLLACAGLLPAAADGADPATAPAPRPKIAVLPFSGASAAEQKLAERMRFALAQKLSNDANGGGQFDRIDSVTVDNTISALQIPWSTSSGKVPADDDLQK